YKIGFARINLYLISFQDLPTHQSANLFDSFFEYPWTYVFIKAISCFTEDYKSYVTFLYVFTGCEQLIFESSIEISIIIQHQRLS
ncbi:MAG TPA: hypothetical protein DCY53_01220, partial [Desulfobacteraceae bacterium]|nr:hypothetical protein [Desulfobacteraceae bacterium]